MFVSALCLAAALVSLDFNELPPGAEGLPQGWIAGTWGVRKCSYGSADDGFGGRAMRVMMTGNFGGELQLFSPAFPLWQGRWYRVSFRAKGIDHPGKIALSVRKIDYPWTCYAGGVTFRPANEWKTYSFAWRSKHDVQSGFGVMVSTGSVGCFLIDDLKVEELEDAPAEQQKRPPNPPVAGNLIPRSSFEPEGDNFFIDRCHTDDADVDWQDARHGRSADGKFGKHSLRLPWQPLPRGQVLSVPVAVSSGRSYVFSGWVKVNAYGTAPFHLGGNSGKWTFGKDIPVPQDGLWHRVEASTGEVPDSVRDIVLCFGAPNGHDVSVDGMQFELGEKASAWAPRHPYEIELSFDCSDSRTTPATVEWGSKIPLRMAAYPAAKAPEREIAGELIVTAYPDRVVHRERISLRADGMVSRRIVDPRANGILRVEFRPDDPTAAASVEKVMARLPRPRGMGREGGFGTHFRVSPYFINYVRSLGFTWQRLHDCSMLCKMDRGNPKPGEYRWYDEQVDAIRAAGLSILALPDWMPKWATKPGVGGKLVYDAKAFGSWCETAAAHYKGRIDHWEIWNEPYISGYFFRGTAEEFGPVFNVGAEGIRRGNPMAKVLGWCTELSSPEYVLPFLKKYPVSLKPDINSVHYYFVDVPGDGEMQGMGLVRRMKEEWGEYAAEEVWDTEGNMSLTHSFYNFRNTPKEDLDRGVAFGVRCWADSFASGIAKVFIYSLHGTDNPRVGDLQTLIDYDRSVTPEAVATAVTAYFIDGLKAKGPVSGVDGRKEVVFCGDGRTVRIVWDDVLVPGRARFKYAKMRRGSRVYDAMGNERVCADGDIVLSDVPFFVVEGE